MKATRLLNAVLLLASALNALGSNAATKDDFPRVWISSEDHADAAHFADLATHGAQVIETEDFKRAREHGLQIMFMVGRIGPQDVIRMGMTPEYAVAIGGTYNDLSIESHTFPFTKGQHTIEIFQPWFYAPFDWKRQQYLTNNRTFGDYFGEFSTDRAFKAEVLVKQRDYDGKQHLAIVPATVTERKRHSLFVTFDLSNIDGDLDHTMLAVYWRASQLSPAAASTREAMVQSIRAKLDKFTEENGGTFPADVVRALRFGDECFLMTGFAHSPKASLPLYEYSESGLAGFCKLNGGDGYPRVWGFPEVFGVNAYRDWLYAYHKATAELVKAVVTEVHKVSTRILVFRNPTRFNPTTFATLPNDHDGCGTQLLAEQFDMINADPYPVSHTGDSQYVNPDRDPRPGYIESIIPLECAYWSGLIRRYDKKFVCWLQAHTFAKDLQHISPSDAHHIYDQVARYNPDGIMWLGYKPGDTTESPFLGMTLPDARPETWKAIRSINYRAQRDLGRPKAKPNVAVLRFYAERSLVDLERHNLHDRFLTERILTGLTMDLDIPYDIFEYYKKEDVDPRVLRSYQQVILCVMDLDGLPLDQFAKEKIPLSIVCWNGASLAAHSGFTGVKFSNPLAAGAVVASRAGKAQLSAALAVGATLEGSASALAKSGEQSCLWRQRNAVIATFIPQDPFDDGEYVRWLLDEKQAPEPKRSNN
jgi:hypothetical protein